MLRHLLRKELKELLMEKSILIGAIIIPLIIFPIMGALTGFGVGAAMEKTMGRIPVGLADLDGTNLTMSVLPKLMEEEGIEVVRVNCMGLNDCINAAMREDLKFMIVIPREFTRNFTAGLQSRVETIYSIRSLTLSDLMLSGELSDSMIEVFRSLAEKLHGKEINPKFFEKPVIEDSLIIYFGRVVRAPIEAMGSMFLTVLFGLPMVAVIVASYASTISATSIALEKESKTLEVLLAIPARRLMILLSKLLGTFLIVILSTISFLAGFGIYGLMLAGSMGMTSSLGGLGETSPVQFSLPAIQPSPIFLPILVASIFIAMVMMTCIGLLVGILGGDVRGAQQLVGAITFPLLMPPFLILLFTSIESLPLGIRLALLADPFTHLFLAIRSGVAGDLASALMSIGVMLSFTILLLVLSSWFFMGERLITVRVSLRRRGSSKTRSPLDEAVSY